MAQVGVDDDAEALELIEVAVDGRQVDVRGLLLHLGGQILGRVVTLGVETAPGGGVAARR